MEPEQALVPIPSDLHVLGLPLAFILSQDQTLHCKMKFLIPTIYIIRILFYISDLGSNWTNSWICSWLSFCLLVTLTWLCFLKELLSLQLPYPLYSDEHCAPLYLFSVSLRFRWDCKGRNLFWTSKKLLKFFSFPFFRFPRLTPVRPFFFQWFLLSK